MAGCDAPLADDALLDYWTRTSADGAEPERLEEHLFACGDCTARLERLAALGAGVSTLVRQGRVSGIISRTLLNRMQRDGVRVRLYSVAAGETVPCAIFPDDDLVVCALRADLSGVEAVGLSVTGESFLSEIDGAPVFAADNEVLWATPGAIVRQMPSMRLRLTLTSAGAVPSPLGQYVLDHSASPLG